MATMATLRVLLTAWICSIFVNAGAPDIAYKRCEFPKVFTLCATSCPATCDTIGLREPRPCIAACRPGVNCVCPKGYVEISKWDSTCVKTSQCPCQLPKDPGPCKAAIPSYFFNAVSGKCDKFSYGGCRGNSNRFKTLKKCKASCSLCKLDKDPGPCDGAIRRYYYNRRTADCEIFQYGGCPGNANNFVTRSACRKTCVDKCESPKVYKQCPTSCPATCNNIDTPEPRPCIAACRNKVNCVCPKGYVETSTWDSTCVKKSDCPCNLPKDPGPCRGSLERFFFNKKTGDCEDFTYGGCKGNPNNFKTLDACRKKCADPCIFMKCGKGQTCKDGKCVALCKPPKIFEQCPTSCPATCNNIDTPEPRPCIAACRRNVNCVCPKGYVETSTWDSTCVKKSDCPCNLPKDPGPCRGSFRRFFYNKKTGDCKSFTYGGCKGNPNNFETLFACRKKCADPCYPKRCSRGTVCKNGRCLRPCGSGYCPKNGVCKGYGVCYCSTIFGYSKICTVY